MKIKYPDFGMLQPNAILRGVYKIVINDNLIYIGSSVKLRSRFSQWKSILSGKGKYKGAPAIQKIIPDVKNIQFIVLEFTDKDSLIEREDFYLKKEAENPLLINQSPGAFSNFGYKIITPGKHTAPKEVS